ncbi:Crp/Fnr family transcriptional regulator [Chryseobacterium flavum]|uniref:Crp/Fnr family transcriptional regulator n=1 Tax=Chryseobacterium flavum TaxID=415851 RepID=UPI0028AF6B17|nr:Crp/Fnr family transcriptional regulator [Chryseobacterium flavum]
MLPYESLEKFIGISTTITIKRNDHFVKEDDICRYIGIVKSGTLYSYFEDSDANMLVNELYSKQSVITSYRSFLNEIPSPAYIKAYSDSEIYAIEKKVYRELMQYQEWTLVFKEISDELFTNKCFKETSLIKLKARERYLALLRCRPHLEQDFPQHLIASYLKIRPETLSRIKSVDLYQDHK